MPKLNEWLDQTAHVGGADARAGEISRRAWAWFHEHIADSFLYRLFRLVGRVRAIFVELFGEDPNRR